MKNWLDRNSIPDNEKLANSSIQRRQINLPSTYKKKEHINMELPNYDFNNQREVGGTKSNIINRRKDEN